jgi:hypothetical protein
VSRLRVAEERRVGAVRQEQREAAERSGRSHVAAMKRLEAEAIMKREAWASHTRKRLLGAFSAGGAGGNGSGFGTASARAMEGLVVPTTTTAAAVAGGVVVGAEEAKARADAAVVALDGAQLPLAGGGVGLVGGGGSRQLAAWGATEVDAYVEHRARAKGGDHDGTGGGQRYDPGPSFCS